MPPEKGGFLLRERAEAGALRGGEDKVIDNAKAELPLNASEQDSILLGSTQILRNVNLY